MTQQMILALALLIAAMPATVVRFAVAPMGDAALATIAGKADPVQAVLANNSATVANSRIVGISTTGVISIDGNAFQNLNALAVINANTGNNVAINASLNVTVSIRP